MFLLAKYGVSQTIEFPLIKRGAVDFAVSADWTPASGDVQIIKDGGTAAATTNLPTAVTSGNGAVWKLTLTATEMQAARIVITIVDAATKAIEDQALPILTYGNASAHIAADLSVVQPTAAQIATAILTDLLSGSDFSTAGSFGKLIKDNLDAQVSTRSTYAGADTPGTGTLLTRITAAPPTAAQIATAILTDLLSGSDFATAGSFGKLIKDNLDATVSSRSTYAGGDTSGVTTLLGRITVAPPTAAQIATAILTDLLSGSDFATAGSFGKLIKDNLDAQVSTRSTYAGADTPGTGTLLTRITAAPPTAAQIVTAIWTDLLAGTDFATAGSIGKLLKDNLDAKVSTISGGGGGGGVTLTQLQTELAVFKGVGFSQETDTLVALSDAVAALTPTNGTGAFTLAITVHDQDGQPLEGATVRVTEGVTSLVRTTRADGTFSPPFAVDANTYAVVITKPGYDFEPTTLSITANRTITYTLTQVAITPDPDPAKTRVVMTTFDERGLIKPNVHVTFGLVRVPVGDVNHVLSVTRFTVASDTNGVIDVSLWTGGLYEATREDSPFKIRFTPTGDVYDVPSFVGPSA